VGQQQPSYRECMHLAGVMDWGGRGRGVWGGGVGGGGGGGGGWGGGGGGGVMCVHVREMLVLV